MLLVWLVTLLWMAAILYTSSLGAAITPVAGVWQTIVAKVGHIVEYAVLGLLLSVALQREQIGRSSRVLLIVAATLIGTVFAGFDELRQSFSPGREPRLTDVALDCLSVLAGAIGATRLRASSESRSAPSGAPSSASPKEHVTVSPGWRRSDSG